MRFLFYFVLSIFLLLQYSIWLGNDGLNKMNINKQKSDLLKEEFQKLAQRNANVKKEINYLKNSDEAIIEIARQKLGYIKQGEIFYKIENHK